MNVCIVGQGAIGLLMYAKLSQYLAAQTSSNFKISLLASNTAWKKNKYLSFVDDKGTDNNIPINHAHVDDLSSVDVCIICVKSYQIASAVNAYHQALRNDAVIVLCHNGLGAYEHIVPSLTQPLVAMLTTHGSKKHQTAKIEHTGVGTLDLGLIQGDLSETKKAALLGLFASISETQWQENIVKMQWTKLAVNCVINPITAIENIDNGELLNPKYRLTVLAIIEEVVNIAKTQNVVLEQSTLLDIVLDVAKKTAKNCSSMRSDVLHKRQTEVDFINGYIHRLGITHHIKTPENTMLWQQVHALPAQ